ncbi:MAG: C39 family peptidase [Candidatus Kerfeldbacteria bacterium]
MKKILALLLAMVVVGVAAYVAADYFLATDIITETDQSAIMQEPGAPEQQGQPAVQPQEELPEDTVLEPQTPLPNEANLDIPFTPQAPHANWDLPYQEACEEASMMMAARFLQGRTIEDADDADRAILQLVEYGKSLGYPVDTTAEETATILTSFYGLRTEVLRDFSWDEIKEAIADGYPVIIPAAGQQLQNPNFTEPGPRYHMLVIKGYSPEKIITNDPGTKNGFNYEYDYNTLFSAIHDWNGGDVDNGAKAAIIVMPE